jgi:hypothetical protein
MLDKLKEKASKNCGACGDAFATGNNVHIVCWAMTNGTFNFAVDVGGKIVEGLKEAAIEALMIVNKCEIVGANEITDRRGLV